MEMSMELLVLESSFQLLNSKIKGGLKAVSKEECKKHLHIVILAAEEIVYGLQYDNDEEEQLSWQHKIHSLLFYSLVKRTYMLDKVSKVEEWRVLKCSTLDILSQFLPDFNAQVYFEIIKHFRWTAIFIESLSYLDQKTSKDLFNLAVHHCSQEPVTVEDSEMIGTVVEQFFSRCLLISPDVSPLIAELLTPLMQPQEFIWTVEPLDGSHEVERKEIVVNRTVEGDEYENKNLERERVERENFERERFEREYLERERVEKDNLERYKLERDALERNNIEREFLERDNLEREKFERDNLERGRVGDRFFDKYVEDGNFVELLIRSIEEKCNKALEACEDERNENVPRELCEDEQNKGMKLLYEDEFEGEREDEQQKKNVTRGFRKEKVVVGKVNVELDKENVETMNPGIAGIAETKNSKHDEALRKIEDCLGQVGLLVYLLQSGRTDLVPSLQTWLTYNLIGGCQTSKPDKISKSGENSKSGEISKYGENSKSGETLKPDDHQRTERGGVMNGFCVNEKLAKHLVEHSPVKRVKKLVAKLWREWMQKKGPERSFKGVVSVLPGFEVKLVVLERLLISFGQVAVGKVKGDGDKVGIEDNDVNDEGNSDIVIGQINDDNSQQLCNPSAREVNKSVESEVSVGVSGIGLSAREVTESLENEVSVGVSWIDDVTLDALLWRIEYEIPQYQDCVEKLLERHCWKFWTSESLIELLQKRIPLLSNWMQLLKLWDIICHFYNVQLEANNKITCDIGDRSKGSNLAIIHPLRQLFLAVYTELPFPDQDLVVMVIHTKGIDDVKKVLGVDDNNDNTNIFNKISSDLDSTVVSELMCCFLVDPVQIVRCLVEHSVRNDQQAVNMAKVLSYMKVSCQSMLPWLPREPLLAGVLRQFLLYNKLTEKEEKCFLVFIQQLVQDKKAVLQSTQFIVSTLLPNMNVSALSTKTDNSSISLSLVLNLLKHLLGSVCKEKADWSTLDFQPIALLVTFAELLHECEVLWDSEDGSREPGNAEMIERWAVELGTKKIEVKGQVIECMKELGKILKEPDCGLTDIDAIWLMVTCSHLHWTVVLWLAEFCAQCGHSMYVDHLTSSLSYLEEDGSSNIMALLKLAAINRAYVDGAFTDSRGCNYEDLVAALVQLLPQLLPDECMNVLSTVCSNISTLCDDSWLYRCQSTSQLPLHHIPDTVSALYTSQLLADCLVAMVTVTDSGPISIAMLQYSLKNYTSYIKTLCCQLTGSVWTQLHCLSEVYHHISSVAFHLSEELRKSMMVALLYIASRFQDLVSNCRTPSKNVTQCRNLRVGDSLKHGTVGEMGKYPRGLVIRMLEAVSFIDDDWEEKQMLIKKLSEAWDSRT